MKDLTKLKERALACHIIDDDYHHINLQQSIDFIFTFKRYVDNYVDPFFKYTNEQLIYLKEITWEYIIDESERITI